MNAGAGINEANSSDHLVKELSDAHLKIVSLEKQILTLNHEVKLLMDALQLTRQKMFGRQTEKSCPDQPDLFTLEQLDEAQECHAITKETSRNTKKSKHNPNLNGRVEIPPDLPRKDIFLDLADDKKICPKTGKPLIKIGEDISEQLAIRPPEFYAIRYHIPKYASPDRCAGIGVFTPELPPHPLNRCKADVSLLSYIIEEKYLRHTPLYRLAEKFSQEGVSVSPSTMNDWISNVADVCVELMPPLRKEILALGAVNADDTYMDMLIPHGEKEFVCSPGDAVRQGRLWCYHSRDRGLSYFEFTKDWKHEHPISFLKNYSGYLQSDGYEGYNKATATGPIIHVGCWAHCRRKFVDAQRLNDPEADKFVLYANLLYRIEHRIREWRKLKKYPDDILLYRRTLRAKRVMDRFFALARNTVLLPKSALGKALTYALGHEKQLRNYLLDLRLSPDNNPALSSSSGYSQDLAIPA